ncbi:MAG: M1 family aminopeptidase [Bacteroidales bacterium]|nr:M1 family aminopeptidase [Bacteroidales bacterium]
MMRRFFFIFCCAFMVSCSAVTPEPGVSQALARERAANISDVSYGLWFNLLGLPDRVRSSEELTFTVRRRADVVLDFKAPEGSLLCVVANGDTVDVDVMNEHLVIPREKILKGENELVIQFMAGTQSLNNRGEFVYTLLVPDRARTLFPCFDQPDMKAVFNLSLDVPQNWVVVSNTAVGNPTGPLSTYLFSFVAGKFERLEASRDGRTVSMYHRENDPAKLAQTDDIFDLVFDSLDWMEEYTGVPYPFAKYDFIVLPDFQYGGMEHTGAMLYNDRRIFLGPAPTTNELLNRASLIAHETAHMWFGDYVTMEWFNDVWTKEVFANWFSSKMIRPQFPEVNHTLSDLRSLYAPAYEEDRTEGRCAIQRPLDNLQNAGLIYCNTIYDKAPVVMEMLAEKLGPEKFRACLQEYLRRFGYGNATWDDLIAIFDAATDENLSRWSDRWVKKAGMPEYAAGPDDELVDGRYWVPNLDGKGYGWYRPDAPSMDYIMEHWSGYDDTGRMSLLMTLYENSWHGTLDRRHFVEWGSSRILQEPNALVLNSLLSYVGSEYDRLDTPAPEFCEALRALAADGARSPEQRLLAFRQYYGKACTDEQKAEVYAIWNAQQPYPGLVLGETDYTGMAYALMLDYPEKAEETAALQRSRISNPDRLETFDFVSRAASPDAAVRQELFDFLLAAPQNRRPESRVLSALSLLCHRTRTEEATAYILPALEALPEIQMTGDIFFPASWCRTLLANQHDNPEAQRIVEDFIASHPDMNPLLVVKILQAK